MIVSASGENSIVVVPGANAGTYRLSADAVGEIASADVVLGQLEIPAEMLVQARQAMRADALLMLNAAPAMPLTDAQWQAVDLLVVNEHEASVLVGESDPEQALPLLLQRVPRAIVTAGARGSIFAQRGGPLVRAAAYPADHGRHDRRRGHVLRCGGRAAGPERRHRGGDARR